MFSDPTARRLASVPSQVLCALLALAAVAVVPPILRASSKRQRAAAAYQRALKMQAKLEARRPEARSLKDYQKLLHAFDQVYRVDPGYPGTPSALAAEAGVDQEMGRAFSSDRNYEAAVNMYQFLVDQYPASSVARDALYTIGEIYRVDLENPEESGKAYSQFLERYPHSGKAPEARAHLAEVNRRLTAASAGNEKRTGEVAAGRSPSEAPPSAGLAEVSAVRYWEGSNYTRIVIAIGDEAKFDAVRLRNPDRIVFDLPNTRLSRDLAGKAFPVENGFLHQVRVAQFKPDVTRVVLDVGRIEDYSVFSLPNPFRLIIDVRGPPQPIMARSSVPGDGATPASNAREPEAADASVQPAAAGSVTAPEASASASKETESAPRAGVAAAGSEAGDEAETTRTPALTSSGSTTLTRALGLKIARIVIDPGHGGHDTGTIGPSGLEEKEVVLDVALRLKRLIERRMGSQVVMTRGDDTFIPLEERTAIANQRSADLFISIHANASRDPSARGIEVYYLNFTSDPNSLEVAARENATSQESVHQLQTLVKKIALNEKIQESEEFARQVDDSLNQASARSSSAQPNRGVKKAPFVVLIGANMPSILAEISFLTNPSDERLLSQPQYRQKIAEALYRGVSRYVSNLGGVRIAERSPGSLASSSPEETAHSRRRQTAALPSTAPAADDPPDF